MQLLYPIGLLALAGLLVPVIVHLWDVKKGKTLKIGSISLLGESARTNARSWYIKDWPLFLLRCLLLLLIAFLLAQPYLNKTMGAKQQAGWILVEKAMIKQVYAAQQQTIDSLLALGYEWHEFDLGFKPLSLQDTASATSPVKQLDYTTLLKQLNVELPAHYPVYLFAPKQLRNFKGNLPVLTYALNWKTMVQTDTLHHWKSSFWGKAYEASSSPSLTRYQAIKGQVNSPLVNVLVYDPAGTEGKYIKAAIQAMADFTQRNIKVSTWNAAAEPEALMGFWLSDQLVDPKLLAKLKKGAGLLSYAKGKTLAVPGMLQLNASSWNNKGAIGLYQRVQTDQYAGEVIWSDGFGHPILTKQDKDHYQHYLLYSRFNPNWMELVWSDQFVQALMPIVYPVDETIGFGFEAAAADQRQVAVIQDQYIKGEHTAVKGLHTVQVDLSQWCWGLAFLVLIIERILSFRKHRDLGHVKN